MFKVYNKMKVVMNSVAPTGNAHTATVIFFHGSGDTGGNLLEWVRFLLGRNMEFPHIKVLYPTAPLQPYTPLGGQESHVWFDRRAITINSKESRKSMAKVYELVHEIIKEEENTGVPANRIIVGGFSMGGALALHTAYHMNTEVAGAFTCSSFLNRGSIVYESLQTLAQKQIKLPPALMFHGDIDTMVPIEWGRETYDEIKSHGVDVQFKSLNNATHELKKRELLEIRDWILEKLPEVNNLQNKL